MAFPLAALVAVWPAPPSAAGADLHEAGVVTALAGHATASRAGVSRPLRFRDSLVDGDTITTTPPSTLRVLVACKSVVTVRESATWSIVERSGRAGLKLWEGRLGLTTARQLMSKDDVVQVSTPNALASLRGSSLVIEVQRSVASLASVFSVRSGPVEITVGGATTRVDSGQRLRVLDSLAGKVEGLSREEMEALSADLKGGARQHAAAALEFSEMLVAKERLRALGHVFGPVDGPAPRDEVLVAPRTSELRHGNDTAVSSARCAARPGGASGIVRESDTGPPAP